MAARRPPGKRHDTDDGADSVADGAPPPTPSPAPPPPRPSARAERADADPPRVDPDLLDARERRQKAARKPAGPGGQRLQDDDVLIDSPRVTTTAPTDPE